MASPHQGPPGREYAVFAVASLLHSTRLQSDTNHPTRCPFLSLHAPLSLQLPAAAAESLADTTKRVVAVLKDRAKECDEKARIHKTALMEAGKEEFTDAALQAIQEDAAEDWALRSHATEARKLKAKKEDLLGRIPAHEEVLGQLNAIIQHPRKVCMRSHSAPEMKDDEDEGAYQINTALGASIKARGGGNLALNLHRDAYVMGLRDTIRPSPVGVKKEEEEGAAAKRARGL